MSKIFLKIETTACILAHTCVPNSKRSIYTGHRCQSFWYRSCTIASTKWRRTRYSIYTRVDRSIGPNVGTVQHVEN